MFYTPGTELEPDHLRTVLTHFSEGIATIEDKFRRIQDGLVVVRFVVRRYNNTVRGVHSRHQVRDGVHFHTILGLQCWDVGIVVFD